MSKSDNDSGVTGYLCPNGCEYTLIVQRDRFGYKDGYRCPNCLDEWQLPPTDT